MAMVAMPDAFKLPEHSVLVTFEDSFLRLCWHNSKIAKLPCSLQNVANFYRARSWLYQNESLQENMRLTTFFNLYKICILLHRCNLKILAKNRFEKSAIFVKIQQTFCKCRKDIMLLHF